jgi:hypothetical protein
MSAQAEKMSKINRVIKDGIGHVVRTAQLRNIAVRLALVFASTASLIAVMPIVAKESLGVSAGGFGLLSGALGVGSVGAVWLLPILRTKCQPELLAVIASFVWAATAVGLAQSSTLTQAHCLQRSLHNCQIIYAAEVRPSACSWCGWVHQ